MKLSVSVYYAQCDGHCELLESSPDSKIGAQIVRVEAQMAKYDFLFGVSLSALILSHSDNLSKTLQHKSMSASEGQHIAQLILNVLKSLHNQEKLLFYQRTLLDQQHFAISVPALPRVSVKHLKDFRLDQLKGTHILL